MGMTIAEKILSEHALEHTGGKEARPGEYLWARIDGTNITRSMIRDLEKYKIEKLYNPDRVYAIEDHLVPPPTITVANEVNNLRQIVRKYGIKNFFDIGRQGILHEIFPQYGYVSPGDLIAGIDSHTTSMAVSTWLLALFLRNHRMFWLLVSYGSVYLPVSSLCLQDTTKGRKDLW